MINTARGTNYNMFKPKQEEVLWYLISQPEKDVLALLRTGFG